MSARRICACLAVTRDGDAIGLVVHGIVRTPGELRPVHVEARDVELLSVHLDAAGEPEFTGEPLRDAEYDRACEALIRKAYAMADEERWAS